ncbi:FCP1 homology domain [Dillenia turbinata]|uniref:FCP1 homology domain n=1 Tax=Dillenia turbinata TaxID=194707 RepID=A0AAN8V401_9MAGN
MNLGKTEDIAESSLSGEKKKRKTKQSGSNSEYNIGVQCDIQDAFSDKEINFDTAPWNRMVRTTGGRNQRRNKPNDLENASANNNLPNASSQSCMNLPCYNQMSSASDVVANTLSSSEEKNVELPLSNSFITENLNSIMKNYLVEDDNNVSIEVSSIQTYTGKKQDYTYERIKSKSSKAQESSTILAHEEGTGSSMPVTETVPMEETTHNQEEALQSRLSDSTRNKGENLEAHETDTSLVSGDNLEEQEEIDYGTALGESKKRIPRKNSKDHISEDRFSGGVSKLDLPEGKLEQEIVSTGKVSQNAVESVPCSATNSEEDKASDVAACNDMSNKELLERIKENTLSEHCVPSLSCEAMLTNDINVDVLKEKEISPQTLHYAPEKALVSHGSRILLILDINGILADIVPYEPDDYIPDAIIGRKAVFKRPFCNSFLQFCFEKFNVGVWSSRTKTNVEDVVNFLWGQRKKNLLFVWDQSHCTNTGAYTLQNKNKPLLLKELKKLWEKHDPNLPWEKGEYNESNTLLLDDSPYKALRNPPHTGIFPYSFSYRDRNDNALAPKGSLTQYLEELATTDDVQKHIQKKHYGQREITSFDSSWSNFYAKISGANASQVEVEASNTASFI